jgi:hypothetical protein
MRIWNLALALVVGISMIPAKAGAAEVDRAAMTTAAREVARQVDLLQELFGTNDMLLQINGLFQQTIDFQTALSEFRQGVSGKASAEQLAISFDTVDQKLNAILGEVQFVEKDLASLRLVCNKLRSAESNLHFAVFGGHGNPGRQGEKLLRQTMAQQAYVESLSNNISWVFQNREARAGWKDDLAAVRQSLADLRSIEEKKGATPDQIKDQFTRTEKVWGKLIQRYNDAKPQDKILLRSFVALADQGFSRVAPLAGVKDRQATVTSGYDD